MIKGYLTKSNVEVNCCIVMDVVFVNGEALSELVNGRLKLGLFEHLTRLILQLFRLSDVSDNLLEFVVFRLKIKCFSEYYASFTLLSRVSQESSVPL